MYVWESPGKVNQKVRSGTYFVEIFMYKEGQLFQEYLVCWILWIRDTYAHGWICCIKKCEHNKNVRHKNKRKQNQHSKLLFFDINLHFGTSDLISTYGKTASIWSSLLQKCKEETKVYYSVFTLSEKKRLIDL